MICQFVSHFNTTFAIKALKRSVEETLNEVRFVYSFVFRFSLPSAIGFQIGKRSTYLPSLSSLWCKTLSLTIA